MPYRVTRKAREQLARMRASKDAKRLAGPAPDYPVDLPELRREIIILDHDFGTVEHVVRLYRTSRVDCYRVEIDGKPWQDRIGWSKILAGLRKALPRVSST
jgi:hypothetical protein